MGFQGMIRGRSEGGYQRLQKEVEKPVRRPRKRWLRKADGKVILSFRLAPPRRLKWMRIIIVPRRVAEFCAEITRTMLQYDAAYPTIILSGQWGLPVLSQRSLRCR